MLLLSLLPPPIFSLSSQDDAGTTVVELITTFGCVLGLPESIFSSSLKNGGFLLGVAFPVFLSSSLYRRHASRANFLPY